MKKRIVWSVLAAVWSAGLTFAQASAFAPACVYEEGVLKVSFDLPESGHIYQDGFAVRAEDADHPLRPVDASTVHFVSDEAMGGEVAVYEGKPFFHFKVEKIPAVFTVSYQGCDANQCYMPENRTFTVTAAGVVPGRVQPENEAPADETAARTWRPEGFSVRIGGGYLDADEFIAFFNGMEDGAAENAGWREFLDDPVDFVKARGLGIALLFVLLGGILLNLTPCVLPMIPVNLAIIGAGGGPGKRLQGAVRGAAYGAGIALVYGALGLAVVLTGSFFGAVQSSPWFNLAVAVVFVVLALSLFDLFFIDFTRFASADPAKRKQGMVAAFIAGAVSALLAGACVAPVVLAVLLLTGTYYAEGHTLALLLPFLLGVGMALPWPFAGAGLSIAPRPGMWMVYVKYAFGAFLLGLAGYYLFLSWQGFHPEEPQPESDSALLAGDWEGWQKVIAGARERGQTVVVDFWATWCKNCLVMEKTTFRDERVLAVLADALVVKVQAERPEEKATREMLDAYGIPGLPGFVILKPEKEIQP